MVLKRHIQLVKKYFSVIIVLLLPFLCRGQDSSGFCVYPGGFIQVDFSKVVDTKNDYTVGVRAEHSIVELYDSNNAEADVLEVVAGGRVKLSSLKFVKVVSVGGPYFTVFSEIFDGRGNKVAQINSGKICNLKWLKEEHGTSQPYFLEKEVSKADFAVLDGLPQPKSKAALFCLGSLVMGVFMGFTAPKMIEYEGEKIT